MSPQRGIPGRPFSYHGKTWRVLYFDSDTFDDLPAHPMTQVYGVCLDSNRQLLIGLGPQQRWALLGGTPQEGETWQDTLAREIGEESGMKVTHSWPIGYQVLMAADGERIIQLRAGAVVEPHQEFVPSPAISEIKLIDPAISRRYFDWGVIGERLIAHGLRYFDAHR